MCFFFFNQKTSYDMRISYWSSYVCSSDLLGQSGLSTRPFVLGGNVFGMTADRAASFAILDRFVECGGGMIDTADVYSAWVPGQKGGESRSEDRGEGKEGVSQCKYRGRREQYQNTHEDVISEAKKNR